ncbi:MAG TPA: putative metal-dependent hydrolase [Saprospiraceae bacterium]|nr:putative metal-dependent hydrolase [Saprospiraceae bacterium]
MEPTLEHLKYPVGPWTWPETVSESEIAEGIQIIEAFPDKVARAISGFTNAQLDTPYRPGGWTIRQLVHHLADSHMNAYVRFKLALTEDNPVIKPYDQDKWASLADSLDDPDVSMNILTGMHRRWVNIMNDMSPSDWDRPLRHPEHSIPLNLRKLVAQYRWHCEHHLQHILRLRQREGF